MSDTRQENIPKPQASAAGGPPRTPKKTARGLDDQSPEGPHFDIPDPVVVTELASALNQKWYRIIADLMNVGKFCNMRSTVGFEDASKVARKHGFCARRVA